MHGIDSNANAATFSNGVVIPELAYFVFQMTFAMITPALIVGAFAERIKFSAVMLFILLWSTFIYFPIAHWVWYVAAPDDVAAAAKALAAAADGAAKTAAQAKLDDVTGAVGWLAGAGALDFAGGTVVHINSGVAGLVGAILLGKRIGLGKESMAPHSLTMTMIGASMLWFGWFGFNAGSALEANGSAALAFMNTYLATACAVLSWMGIEWLVKGKPSMLGAASGAVAGLVAITPAAGNVGIPGAFIIGLGVGVVCFWGVTGLKKMIRADDALDVFGVHALGGCFGALTTGIFNAPSLGGPGSYDNWFSMKQGYPGIWAQFVIQAKAVAIVVVWTAVVALIAFGVLKFVMGIRVSEEEEREGLDLSSHGERAYGH
jgi:Amt family ammonium transporter